MYSVTLAVLLSVAALKADPSSDKSGSGEVYITDDAPIQRIGKRLYKRELLTDQFCDPKELAYDSASRSLFFAYMDDVIQNSGRASINVVTKKAVKIKGIERNKATAVDADAGEVYFGSDDGLYKYDPIENVAANVGLYNVNIYKLVIRGNVIYAVDANNHMLYKVDAYMRAYQVGDMKTVMEFDVDHQKNIHFMTMCGVYCDTGTKVVKNIDLSVVYHFIVEENSVMGVTGDGLYEIDCRNGTAKQIAELNFFPRSIIFGDYGDIFYSLDNSIYRLRPINPYLVYNIYMKNKLTSR